MPNQVNQDSTDVLVTGLSTSILRHVKYWLSLGFPENELKAIYGEHYDNLNNWRYRVPITVTGEALEAVTRYFDDATIAFKTGLDISYSSIQVFGHLLLTCPTVRDFIVMAIQFQHIATQGCQAVLKEGSDVSSYDLIVPSYSRFNNHQIELTIGAISKLLGEVVDYGPYQLRVHFQHENAELQEKASELSDMPLLFGQSENSILFNTEMLALNINFHDESVFETSKAAIRKRLKALKSESLFPELCESIIQQYLHNGSSNLDFVAELLQLSRRTLQMRLTAQNTNFRKVLDNARKNKLEKILATELSETILAKELGFSSENAFLESFERWKGMPFRQYFNRLNT